MSVRLCGRPLFPCVRELQLAKGTAISRSAAQTPRVSPLPETWLALTGNWDSLRPRILGRTGAKPGTVGGCFRLNPRVDDFPHLRADQSIYVTIIDRKPLPVRPSTIPNLDVVPSYFLLSNTDVKLTTAIDPLAARLKTQLDAIRAQYEHVIVDCPPALSWHTIDACTASDRVLIPVAPGYFELDSIVQISKTVPEVREYFNPQIGLAGFLYTMSDPTMPAARRRRSPPGPPCASCARPAPTPLLSLELPELGVGGFTRRLSSTAIMHCVSGIGLITVRGISTGIATAICQAWACRSTWAWTVMGIGR